jgi:hypothetical protein
MSEAARRRRLHTVSEIGDAENISKSYVSRILRLALLAQDIVEAILADWTDQALMLEHLEQPLPTSWEEQPFPRHGKSLSSRQTTVPPAATWRTNIRYWPREQGLARLAPSCSRCHTLQAR